MRYRAEEFVRQEGASDQYRIYPISNTLSSKISRLYLVNYAFRYTYYDGHYLYTILPMNTSNPTETINKFNSLLILQ
jgi:hypothetical protein